MTPYLWLNLLILIIGDLAFCALLYLIRETIEYNIPWLDKKDSPRNKWR